MKALRALSLAALLAMGSGSFALGQQPLDASSAAALGAALKMLQDPALRQGGLADSPDKGALDAQIQALMASPQLQQEFFALAADIFNDLARGAGGDVSRMATTLERARTDPAGFAATLSPTAQQRLRDLAAKLGAQRR